MTPGCCGSPQGCHRICGALAVAIDICLSRSLAVDQVSDAALPCVPVSEHDDHQHGGSRCEAESD